MSPPFVPPAARSRFTFEFCVLHQNSYYIRFSHGEQRLDFNKMPMAYELNYTFCTRIREQSAQVAFENNRVIDMLWL